MKKLFILSGMAALVFSSCGTSGGSLKSEADSVAYAMGRDMGLYVKNMDTLLGADLNVDVIAAGIRSVLKNDTSVMTNESSRAFMEEVFMVRKPRKDSVASAEFIENVTKENKNAQKTESGLVYEIIEQGGEPKPDSASTVRVQYQLSLRDGKVIESTYDSGDTVSLSLDRVIPGWAEGMQLVGKGGKIKLWIPSQLGYGNRQMPGNRIPANSALVFDVDLIDVVPAADNAKK